MVGVVSGAQRMEEGVVVGAQWMVGVVSGLQWMEGVVVGVQWMVGVALRKSSWSQNSDVYNTNMVVILSCSNKHLPPLPFSSPPLPSSHSPWARLTGANFTPTKRDWVNHVRHPNSLLSICKSVWCLHVVGVIGAYCVRVHICGVDMHVYNSCIPQTEQHEARGQRLFCLGNVTYLLDVGYP